MKALSILFLKIYVILYLLIVWNTTSAQINSTGIPFIQNYSHRTYNAPEANWAVTQDLRGVMYFGNSEYILEYDGYTWQKIPVPGQSYILSLATSQKGRVYAGGVDDFGHLISDVNGNTIYESLAHLINDSLTITRVWKIFSHKELVYFCTLQHIFIYNTANKTIDYIDLPRDSFWSFLVNNSLFTSNYEKGLLVLNSNSIEPALGGDFFIEKDIFSILPWSNDTLLIAATDIGLCFYNNQTGSVSKFNVSQNAQRTSKLIMSNALYAGARIDDNHFAFGTNNDGLFVMNKKGEIVLHVNEDVGLINKIVTNLYFNQQNPNVLWLTLTNGIASINLSSPVRQFSMSSGLNGAIYAIANQDNTLYSATMLGVYFLEHAKEASSKFYPVKGIEGERVYSMLSYKTGESSSKLLAASVRDIYEIVGNRAIPLNLNIEAYRLNQSHQNPNLIYVATSRGIRVLRYTSNGFVFERKVFGLENTTVTKVTEDKLGNLWCTTLTGVKLIDNKGEEIELPSSVKDKTGNIFRFQDEVFLVLDGNVLQYNYSNNSFSPSTELNSIFKDKGRIIKDFFSLTNTSSLAFYECNNSSRAAITHKDKGEWQIDTTSLRIIPSMTINTAFQDNDLTFVGGQEGLFIYDGRIDKNFNQPFRSLIRSIIIGGDSLVYKGADGFFNTISENNLSILQFHSPIDYKHNIITFNFSAPYFEGEQLVQYQSYLEGFDKGWSPWEEVYTRTYTNLSEGVYRFYVRATNIYGVHSNEAVFEFKILPPWYRTWWAFMIYIALALAVIWLSIASYTRKLQEDKRRLEAIVKERTAEIVEKNKKIEHQNIAITDSIRYAKRIQTAVLPDKQTCTLFDYFIYFSPKDIVSGDFYWVHHFEKQKRLIFIAADCTGHGVPGAFMSMLGTSFLNEIVAKLDVNHSDSILNLLRKYVINTLSQGLKEGDKDERKDGMDMALASIDLNNMMLEYSGANNPFVLIRNGELTEYKPDKMPIGAYVKQDIPFQRTNIKLEKEDIFYLFSDGFVDQFGGEDGRKYMKKNFKDFLLSIHHLPMHEQRELLQKEMERWMVGHEQIDDQLIIGVKANF
jgi:serine phosphatase RsbU (regulator of sigma subunit)